MKFHRLRAEGCIYPKNLLDNLIPYWCETFERKMWKILEENQKKQEEPLIILFASHFPKFLNRGNQLIAKLIDAARIRINLLEYYRKLTRAAFEHAKMKSFREWTRLSKHTEELLQQAKARRQIITEESRRASRSERLPQSDIKSTSMAASMPVPPLKIPKGDLLYNLITG